MDYKQLMSDLVASTPKEGTVIIETERHYTGLPVKRYYDEYDDEYVVEKHEKPVVLRPADQARRLDAVRRAGRHLRDTNSVQSRDFLYSIRNGKYDELLAPGDKDFDRYGRVVERNLSMEVKSQAGHELRKYWMHTHPVKALMIRYAGLIAAGGLAYAAYEFLK